MKYIFIDIETTNKQLDFVIDKSELIEIGAIDLTTRETFSCCVKVPYKLSEFTKRLTGIQDTDIESGKTPEEAIGDFIDFLGEEDDLIIIGHNVEGFDIPVLSRYSEFFQNVKYLDTLQLFQLFYPGLEQYSVEYLYRLLFDNKGYKEDHRALQDSIDESRLFEEFLSYNSIKKFWMQNHKNLDFLNILWSKNRKMLIEQTSASLKKIYNNNGEIMWSEFMNNNYIYKYVDTIFSKFDNSDTINEHHLKNTISKKRILADFFNTFDYELDKEKKYQYGTIEMTSDEQINEVYLSCLGDKNPREGQQKVLQYVNNVLNGNNDFKLVGIEAGTGIGKTYGYLIPSMNFLQNNNQYKIFLSTYTKVLQGQIMQEDIHKLGSQFKGVKYAHLKANSEGFDLNNIPFSGENITIYHITLLIWIQRGNYYVSDIHYSIILKMNHFKDTNYIYNPLSPSRSLTDYNKLYGFKGHLNHQIANNNLFVVNHSFLLSQFGGIVKEPLTGYASIVKKNIDFKYYVLLDEAHNIEQTMRDSLTVSYDMETFSKLIKLLDIEQSNSIFIAIQKELEMFFEEILNDNKDKFGDSQKTIDIIEKIHDQATEELQALIEDIDKIFKQVQNLPNLVLKNFATTDLYELSVRDISELRERYSINEVSYGKIDFYKYYMSSQENTPFKSLLDVLRSIFKKIGKSYGSILTNANDRLNRRKIQFKFVSKIGHCLNIYYQYLNQAKNYLETFQSSEKFMEVHVLFQKNKLDIKDFGFKMIPKDISSYNQIFMGSEGSIFLSATLSDSGGNSSYILNEISGGNDEEYIQYPPLHSPFNYKENRKIIVPDINIDDDSEIIFSQKANLTLDYIRKHQGRTLVLTSNNNDKNRIADFLYQHLNNEGIMIKKHESGSMNSKSNRQNVQALIKNPRTVLIGSKSYMEGVDVPGDNLSLVVLWKLPFLPPSPFMTDYLNKKTIYNKRGSQYVYQFLCSLGFRQAIGRLIRSESDTGEILILDPRINDQTGDFFRDYLYSEEIYSN